MDELLPCPFCRSKDLRIRGLPRIYNDLTGFEIVSSHVECLNCGADGPKIAFVKDVVIAWNLRNEMENE